MANAVSAQDQDAIFRDERDALHRFFSARLPAGSDIDNLVQESYLRLHGAQVRGGERIKEPRRFLYRIAANLVIDRYRSSEYKSEKVSLVGGESVQYELASQDATPERSTIAAEQIRVLGQAIESLPPRCRQVFVMHRLQHVPYREIARLLGISSQMVERHIAKALRICAQRLRPHW